MRVFIVIDNGGPMEDEDVFDDIVKIQAELVNTGGPNPVALQLWQRIPHKSGEQYGRREKLDPINCKEFEVEGLPE